MLKLAKGAYSIPAVFWWQRSRSRSQDQLSVVAWLFSLFSTLHFAHPVPHWKTRAPFPKQRAVYHSRTFSCHIQGYNKRVEEENEKSELELMVANVGKVDPKNHLETNVQGILYIPSRQCYPLFIHAYFFSMQSWWPRTLCNALEQWWTPSFSEQNCDSIFYFVVIRSLPSRDRFADSHSSVRVCMWNAISYSSSTIEDTGVYTFLNKLSILLRTKPGNKGVFAFWVLSTGTRKLKLTRHCCACWPTPTSYIMAEQGQGIAHCCPGWGFKF